MGTGIGFGTGIGIKLQRSQQHQSRRIAPLWQANIMRHGVMGLARQGGGGASGWWVVWVVWAVCALWGEWGLCDCTTDCRTHIRLQPNSLLVSRWYVWWIALNTFKLKRRSKRNELWELARRLPQGCRSSAGVLLQWEVRESFRKGGTYPRFKCLLIERSMGLLCRWKSVWKWRLFFAFE